MSRDCRGGGGGGETKKKEEEEEWFICLPIRERRFRRLSHEGPSEHDDDDDESNWKSGTRRRSTRRDAASAMRGGGGANGVSRPNSVRIATAKLRVPFSRRMGGVKAIVAAVAFARLKVLCTERRHLAIKPFQPTDRPLADR